MSTYRNQQTICVSAGAGALRYFIARLLDYAVGGDTISLLSAKYKTNWAAQETWAAYETYLANNVGTVDQAITAMETSNTGDQFTSQVIYSTLAPSVLSRIFPNSTVISIDSSQTNITQLGYNYIIHDCQGNLDYVPQGSADRVKGFINLVDNNPIDWDAIITDPQRKDRAEMQLLSIVLGRDVCNAPPSTEGADVVVDFAKLTARPKNNAETVASELNLILDAVDSKIVKDRAELHALWLATVNSLTYIDLAE